MMRSSEDKPSLIPQPSSFHILVVDDEEQVRNSLCELIEVDGYRVTGASSGIEALEVLKTTSVDLVLTDVMMPGMNGWQLLREIKKNYEYIPVVPITGYISDEGEALLTDLDVSAYLVKPVDRQRMQILFKALLFSQNLGRPAEIVAIDDDRVGLRLIEKALTKRGFYVTTFSDVHEALIHVRKTPPDLFVIDLVMPGCSGFELCQNFRASVDTTQIPILILTASPTRENVTKALELGVNGFVAKPFNSKDLAEKVLQMLRQVARA